MSKITAHRRDVGSCYWRVSDHAKCLGLEFSSVHVLCASEPRARSVDRLNDDSPVRSLHVTVHAD